MKLLYAYFLILLPAILLLPSAGWAMSIHATSTTQYSPVDSVENDSSFQVHRGYVGMGVGIPYGAVGVNAEYCINPKSGGSVYATAGVGHSLVVGLAYSAGMNVYLRHAEVVWRPRLSLLYGINGGLEGQYSMYGEPTSMLYRGVSAGFGQLFLLGKGKRFALSADALLIASSGLFEKLEDLNKNNLYENYETRGFERVKFSLGK